MHYTYALLYYILCNTNDAQLWECVEISGFTLLLCCTVTGDYTVASTRVCHLIVHMILMS